MSIAALISRSSIPTLVAALALVVAACSGGGATPSPTTAVAPTSPAASPSAAESASPTESESAETGEEYRIEVAENASVGKYLTGEDGKTLYIFKKDTKPNESVCTGECATNWPPFMVEEDEKVEAGDGVTGTIATFDRPDSGKQVSYNGQPLYYFKGDAKAGDVNGQGLANGAWVAATP